MAIKQRASLEIAHDGADTSVLGHGHYLAQGHALASGFRHNPERKLCAAQSPSRPASFARR